MKGQRNWKPCRGCGKAHQNPASSSTCAPCNAEMRRKQLIEDARQREADALDLRLRLESFERRHNIDLDELKELLG